MKTNENNSVVEDIWMNTQAEPDNPGPIKPGSAEQLEQENLTINPDRDSLDRG
jgi:hypothetical protein